YRSTAAGICVGAARVAATGAIPRVESAGVTPRVETTGLLLDCGPGAPARQPAGNRCATIWPGESAAETAATTAKPTNKVEMTPKTATRRARLRACESHTCIASHPESPF